MRGGQDGVAHVLGRREVARRPTPRTRPGRLRSRRRGAGARRYSAGSSTSTVALAITTSSWLRSSTSTTAMWWRRRSTRRLDHLPVEERGVAGEGRVAVLGVRVGDETPLPRPCRHVVEDPRAHRRAVAVAAGHADVLRPAGLEVAARRAVVGAVGQLGVGALHALVALEARHLLGVAELLGADRGGPGLHAAPDGHRVRPPFRGEAGEAVRAEHVLGQQVATSTLVEQALVVAQLLDLVDERPLPSLEIGQLVVGPLGVGLDVEDLLLLGLGAPGSGWRSSAAGRCARPLVDVEGVAPLEAGRAGEAGLGDLVVVRHAVADEVVAGPDAGAEEPPLVAAEDEVRVGDPADLGRRAAVAGVGRDGERLRRDQLAEAALGRPTARRSAAGWGSASPAPSDGCRWRATSSFSSPGAHRHAHVPVEVGGVEVAMSRGSVIGGGHRSFEV